MRQISPDSGCYCDQYEPDWQWAMYGPNYSRLRAIKNKYDADELFWCRKCIGSEDWVHTQDTGSLCRRSTEETWSNYAY
uniref:Berberine/berberine-like domain-containing protein n=1 Tax=Tanacetum cinerariifolium TaxID=118510 RepID=A0A699TVZ7_TANCI|nr:hypothetical protein [Tanacetum cinerariifolium]